MRSGLRPEFGVDISLEYLVRHGAGAKVEKKPQNGRSLVDSKPCTLPPEETVASGGLYDLSKPGHYTVQALERIFDKDDKVIGWVKSNVIAVTVAPYRPR